MLPRNKNALQLNVIILMVAVMIVRQFLVFERKSYSFSVKIRNNGRYAAALQKSEIMSLELLKLNSSLKLENDRLAGELSNLRKRLQGILEDRLRRSVEFIPLKDPNMAFRAAKYRTWFMSTVWEKSENGDPDHSSFPSETSYGKILCLKARNKHNGTLNSYAFAWPNYLPPNSTLVKGLTFIADSFYDYRNPWHSMNSLLVSALWRKRNQCEVPHRFILYRNGKLDTSMGSYITNLLRAVLDRSVPVEDLSDEPVCFEKAVVYRRAFGHMTVERKMEMFDMMRCKARKFCNISESQRIVVGIRTINVTLIVRTGARSFKKNESLVASVIAGECNKVPGCRFRLLRIVNMSFCEQVEVMSRTDILASAHGGQLTNMMFMDKGSSVMEMFPKGWLEGAGVGQYIYQWFAKWTGMTHEGTYRDSQGADCPNPQEGRIACFLFHKNRQVGHNETFLAQWTAQTLLKFQNRTSFQIPKPSSCPCS